MKLWTLRIGKQTFPVALRTRDEIRIWAGRRKIPADSYQEALLGDYHGRAMRVWEAVLFEHPDARIVRVIVREVTP